MSLYQFYRNKEWATLLKIIRNERVNDAGFNICEYCGKPILKPYDCIGHHKQILTEQNYMDRSISLNPDNIALVHHRCHNILHNKLGYSQRQVYVVYGSPLSGKTTWVMENINEGDLVVDMDNIWQCVSGCKRYIKPNRLKSVVFHVRDSLIESVKYRRGKWLNAYIIGGYPFAAERERIIGDLGAREVFIDTPKEECLNRLLLCDDRDIETWKEYINDWWMQYKGEY